MNPENPPPFHTAPSPISSTLPAERPRARAAPPPRIFSDRTAAGRQLAETLAEDLRQGLIPAQPPQPPQPLQLHGLLVLALPRGGVPVGYEVAQALHASLDVLVVRKLGCPHNPELALGAIALMARRTAAASGEDLSQPGLGEILPGGVLRVLNPSLMAAEGISPETLESITRREIQELERREILFREGRPPPQLTGRTVIVVDDGVATGATLQAALQVARAQRPRQLLVAVPVAPSATLSRIARWADHTLVLQTPDPFLSVGQWYSDFSQVPDEAVAQTLKRHRQENFAPP